MERIALLSLDNLTGDDSSAWMTQAVPNVVTAQLTGVGRIIPFRADTSREAAAGGATQMLHGYFDRRGGTLHFEFSLEDAASHAMRPIPVTGDALRAADSVAKALVPEARRFSTQNAAAVEAWGKGNLQQAVQLDPDFGTAWRDLIQTRAGQPDAASLAAQALARGTLRSPVERAQISLFAALLRGDAPAASQARIQLAGLVPNDPQALRRFADEESNARNFPQSVQFYQLLLKLQPDDAVVENFLGYAQFYAGDLTGARKSFAAYGKRPEQAANALDSEGEVLFMAGQFGEAERYFLQAHAANPNMLGGGDLQKAAYAHWLAGDLRGADTIFNKYIQYRTGSSNSKEEWRKGGWFYATGREARAMELLTGNPVAQAQLQLLTNRDRLLEQLTSNAPGLERQFRATPAANDGLVRVLYARALLKAGRRAEAAKLAALWPLPESGDAALQPLLYPIYLELKKDLAK